MVLCSTSLGSPFLKGVPKHQQPITESHVKETKEESYRQFLAPPSMLPRAPQNSKSPIIGVLRSPSSIVDNLQPINTPAGKKRLNPILTFETTERPKIGRKPRSLGDRDSEWNRECRLPPSKLILDS